MENLTIALFLAAVNEGLVNYLSEPLKQKYPELDTWWLMYVALITGSLLGWFSGVNLFVGYIQEELVAKLLTAVAIGAGSSLLHELFD